MKALFFPLLSLLALLMAMQTRAAELQNSKEFEAKWAAYVDQASGCVMEQGKCVKKLFELQPGCTPLKYEPAEGTYKGTVMMFPGFTNCPEEYSQLGEVLKNAGYEVIMPDLPGHGHIRLPGDVDDLSAMPDDKGHYDSLAQEMNELMKLARPGQKIVVGHSVGGAVATRAMELAPTLYDRGVLFTPFYNISGEEGAIPNEVLYLAGNVVWYWDSGPKMTTSCQDSIDARTTGHGYCSLKVSNLAAVRDLGKESVENAGQLQTVIQVIGAVKDPSANNGTTIQLFESSKTENHICVYKGAPHPLLDPQKWSKSAWVKSILVNVPRFLNGIAYPTEGESPTDGNLPYCQ